jgi:RNA polymerase sigma-B factor
MTMPLERTVPGPKSDTALRDRRRGAHNKSAARPGDEQVAPWLEEYARLRASAEDPGRPGRRRESDRLSELQARIAEHYTGLVESIARRFTGSGEPLEDLSQEGFLGLLSALDNYDPAKGVKFSTYATHFVAGAMRHCLRDRGKIIKEPAWLHELGGKIHRATDTLTHELGRAPHAAEIARALNLTEESVEEILSTRQVFQVASFDSDPDSDAAGLVDPEKIKSDKYVTLQLPIEDRIVLDGAVEKLKALEQKVLYEFFYKDLNQTEIARKFGISCNYVSHILKNSTKKLRRILGEAEIRDRGRTREGSIVDAATGLYTAAHVEGRLEEELSRAARGGHPLAVVVIALEGLPPAGRQRDDLLGACGGAVRAGIRRVDIAGRLRPGTTAETLLVLLPHTGAPAAVVSERLLGVLGALAEKATEPFTVRCGFALFPEQGRSAAALLAAAQGEEARPALAA